MTDATATRLHRLVATDAHEGPVYAADEDALYFTTDRPLVSIMRLDLATGRVDVWFTDPAYGHLQGFRPEPVLGEHVYRCDGAGGDQQYRLPAGARVAGATVVIWCRAFSVDFGSARLGAV